MIGRATSENWKTFWSVLISLKISDVLGPQNFPSDLVMVTPYIKTLPDQEELSLPQARQIATEEFERSYLKNLLKRCKGKINLSAKKSPNYQPTAQQAHGSPWYPEKRFQGLTDGPSHPSLFSHYYLFEREPSIPQEPGRPITNRPFWNRSIESKILY